MPEDIKSLPQEVKDKLNNEIKSMINDGYGDEDIIKFRDLAVSEYNKKKDETEYEISSDWWKDSGLSYSDEKKRRTDFVGILGRVLSTRPGTPLVIGDLINKTEDDKLTPEMVAKTDQLIPSIDPTNRHESVMSIKKELNSEFNPGKSKYTARNIDLIVESAQIPAFMDEALKTMGDVSLRDVILNDPAANEEVMKNFAKLGWNPDVIKSAFDKMIYAKSDQVFSESFIKSMEVQTSEYENSLGLKPGTGAGIIYNLHMSEAISRAKNLFDEGELKRMELVKERDSLARELAEATSKRNKDEDILPSHIQQLDAKIKALDAEIEKGIPKTRYIPGSSTYGGAMSISAGADATTFNRMSSLYDAFGNAYGAEDDKREQAVRKELGNYQHLTTRDLLMKEMMYRYGIMKDIEFAKNDTQKRIDDNQEHLRKTGFPSEDSSKLLGKMTNISQMYYQSEIKFEAISRMLLLNHDLTDIDRDASYYGQEFGRVLLDKNGLGKKLNATEAEIHEVSAEVMENAGIELTDEQKENTQKDIWLDITRGVADMTDFTVKMMALNGVLRTTGVTPFIESLKQKGLSYTVNRGLLKYGGEFLKPSAGKKAVERIVSRPLGKISAEIINSAVEGVKFAAVGGDFGTGAMFHVAGMATPSLGFLGKSAMANVVNNFYKTSIGLTVSMEAVESAKVAMDAIANDQNVSRALAEAIGGHGAWENFKYITPETGRRVLVEIASGLPFGFTTLRDAMRAGNTVTKPHDIANLAKEMRDLGMEDMANDLAKISALLGNDNLKRKTHELELKYNAVLEFNRQAEKADVIKIAKKATIEEIRTAYTELVEKTGFDEVAEVGMKAYKSRDPLTEKETPFLIDYIQEMDRVNYLSKRGIDITEMDLAEIKAEYEYQKSIETEQLIDESKIYEPTPEMKGKLRELNLSEEANVELGQMSVTRVLKHEVERIEKRMQIETDKDVVTDLNAHVENLKKVLKEERSRVAKQRVYTGSPEKLELSKMRKDLDGSKVKDEDWENKQVEYGKRLYEVIETLKEKVGAENVRTIVEAFTGTQYDKFIESITSGVTKANIRDNITAVEGIMRRAERGYTPGQKVVTVERESDRKFPALTVLKKEIAAFDKGWKEGIEYFREQTEMAMKSVSERLTPKMIELAGLKKSELDVIFKQLPKDVSKKDVENRIEKLDQIMEKIESRAIRDRIDTIFDNIKPKRKKDGTLQGRVDPITFELAEIANILYNNKTSDITRLTAKTEALLENARANGRDKEAGIYQAQLNALRLAGNPLLLLERKKELAEKQLLGEGMNEFEKLEYDLLDMSDYTSMSRDKLLRIEQSLKNLQETGETIQLRIDRHNKIRKQVDRELALESIQYSEDRINEIKAKKGASSRGSEEFQALNKAQKFFETMNNFTKRWIISSESFFTLTEFIMRKSPDRENFGGYLFGIANDMARAREAKLTRTFKKAAERLYAQNKIWGSVEKARDQMTENTVPRPFEVTINGEKVVNEVVERKDDKGRTIGKDRFGYNRSVNQISHVWQNMHNPKIMERFASMGWGMYKTESGAMEFDPTRLMKELEDFIVKHGGKESLEYAKWNMEVFYKNYYAEINDVYRRVKGTDIPFEYMYSPVFADGFGVLGKEQDISILQRDPYEHMIPSTPANAKARSAGEEIGVRTDIDMEQLAGIYVDKMEHFMAFQENINRARNVYTNENMKVALAEENGSFVNPVIEKFLANIAVDKDQSEKNVMTKVMDKIASNFVIAKLGYNFGLLPKQLTSVSAYRMGIGMKNGEQERFAAYVFTPSKEMFETIKFLSNTPFLKNRVALSSFEREVAELQSKATAAGLMVKPSLVKRGGSFKTAQSRKEMWNNIIQNSMIMTKAGDLATIMWGGQAFFRIKYEGYVKAGFKPEIAKFKAYEDFVKVSKLTQQSGFMEDLSHFQRMGSFGRMLNLFQNTPLQFFRIETSAISQFMQSNKDLKAAKERGDIVAEEAAADKRRDSLKTFVTYHFILPGLFRAVSQGLYVGDDKFTEDAGMLTPIILGSLSYTFVLGAMIQSVIDQITTGHTFGIESAMSGVMVGVLEGATDFIKLIGDGEEGLSDLILDRADFSQYTFNSNIYPKLELISEVAGNLFGIPTTAPLRYIEGIDQLFSGEEPDIRKVLGFPKTATGEYLRSRDFNVMKPYLDLGEDGLPEFLKHMVSITEPEEFSKNSRRWVNEFRMYQHFGAWNPEINYLYSGRLSKSQKAKYLYDKMTDRWKLVDKPFVMKFEAPFTKNPVGIQDEGFVQYYTELLEYGVITEDVLEEFFKLYAEKNKKDSE